MAVQLNTIDDSFDVQNRRNSLCGQINDERCYFKGINMVTKLKPMHSFCSSLYGKICGSL